jgi:transglutaminase-like putative cysteine protease
MKPQSAPRGVVRLGAVALLACTALALAHLPARDFPPGWLLALAGPGAILGRLPRTTAPWRRALLAVLLQSLALWLALEHAGTLSRPAALAGTILPPLAFASTRQQDADGALGLFLSFCVLLVGVILDRAHLPLLAAYSLAACTNLRAAAHLAARRVGRAPARIDAGLRTTAVAGSAIGLLLPCLLAAIATERSLGLLPSPGRSPDAATDGRADDRGRRRIGLDDAFVLDGATGALTDLHGERLVRARSVTSRPVPEDLYLRSGFFALPGMDRWRVGDLDATVAAAADGHVLRRPLPQARVEWLEIERFSGASEFVFVPPGTVEVRGVDGLAVDDAREWLRPFDGSRADVYAVAFQRLPPPAADLPLDPRARRLGLLTLPPDLDPAPFERLLDEWGVSTQPKQAAAAIAEGLAARCRYERTEPSGPYAHALENFLFATGDRRGYCMHFASAAALLLRLRGIPCRIGVGLYGGDPDPRDAAARRYGSQHAHAWVEIPFAGRGFVVFDPTPPAERGQRMPSRTDSGAAPDSAPAGAATAAAGGWRAVLDFLLQPWLPAVVLLLALGSTLWPAGPVRGGPAPTPTVARSARRLLARLLRALGAAGHWRTRGETLEQFALRLRASGHLPADVAAAFTAYQEVRFGGREFDQARARLLQLGIGAAERMQPPTAPVQSVATAGHT